MKNCISYLTLCAALCLPAAAQADCFVAYKAKQDNPLRLHYGVLSLSGGCPSNSQAQSQADARLRQAGWTLLNVTTVSDSEPSAQMKADAGEHYLRY
ncbi:MAG: hypothetical protein N4A70_03610 [Pelagimonas sp.]|jgi:hypothetical protein|nr:hypothetical protein [Pelagimonas sp.]